MPERSPGKPYRSIQRPAAKPTRTRNDATAVRADQAESENPKCVAHCRHEKPCSFFSTRPEGSAAFNSARHADKNSSGTLTCSAFTMLCHAFSRSRARLHKAHSVKCCSRASSCEKSSSPYKYSERFI